MKSCSMIQTPSSLPQTPATGAIIHSHNHIHLLTRITPSTPTQKHINNFFSLFFKPSLFDWTSNCAFWYCKCKLKFKGHFKGNVETLAQTLVDPVFCHLRAVFVPAGVQI